MFRKILFPTDFSEISLCVLENCVPMLKAKEVIVVHVIEYVEDPDILESLQMKAKEKMDKAVESLKEKGLDVRGFVTIGGIATAISREARCPSIEILDRAYCEMVDAIVMPSKGRHARRVTTIGSTALNVVRRSRVPVMVVRCDYVDDKPTVSNCEDVFKRPLVALDFSPCSDVLISTLRDFEGEMETCTLLHVIDYGDVEELEENIAKAKRALDIYAEKFGFELEKLIETGDPSKVIISKALEKESTLIVLGKVGRSLLRELLLGSVTTSVVKESNIPTLVVPCR